MVFQHPSFHFHAYQPGDMIDLKKGLSLWQAPQYVERASPVHLQIRKKDVKALNWTEGMLGGYKHLNDLFEELFSLKKIPVASIDIEPWTMTKLLDLDNKNNTTIFSDLISLYTENKIEFVMTVPFHPILPLVADFEKDIFAQITFKMALPIINKRAANGHNALGIWLPECAYNRTSLATLSTAFLMLYDSGEISKKTQLYVLLDHLQGEKDLNPGSLHKTLAGDVRMPVVYRDHYFSDVVAFAEKKSAYELACDVASREDVYKNERNVTHLLLASMDLESLLYNEHYAQRFVDLVSYLNDWTRTVIAPPQFIFTKQSYNSFPEEPYETNPHEDSSWSDYFTPTTLARWTGIYNDKTFWRQYKDQEICQIWKTGYLKMQQHTVEIIREAVFTLLSKHMSIASIPEFLTDYVHIFFKPYFSYFGITKSQEDFEKKYITNKDKHTELVLDTCGKAYYFCLASLRSCPGFWENIDTRVMQANIFHSCASISLLLQLCDITKDDDLGKKLISFYEEHFLNFSHNFEKYKLDQYGCTEEDWHNAIFLENSPVDGCIIERTAHYFSEMIPKRFKHNSFPKKEIKAPFTTAHIEAEQRFFENTGFCEHRFTE